MRIDQIILIRDNGIPLCSFREGKLSQGEEMESLVAGMLKAVDSFSEELFQAGLYSYQTTMDQRVTLLKQGTYILAIFGDSKSLLAIPPIVREFIFRDGIDEHNLKGLEAKLAWVFWPSSLDETIHRRGLVLTVGRSVAPLWFALSRHAPEFVVFIASEQTKPTALDLVKFFGYELEVNAKVLLCDQGDTTAITHAGIAALEFFTKNQLPQETVAVNATGGTKGMTIAIAHTSYAYSLPVYYVESPSAQEQKLDKFYGDERIEYLDNPSESVGVFWEKIALEAFNGHNFLKAHEYFDKMRGVFDANKRTIYQALRELSSAYQEWDLFNFKPGAQHLGSALKILQPNLYSEFGRHYQGIFEQLKAQGALLDLLKDQIFDNQQPLPDSVRVVLCFELLNNARRRFEQAKYDDAVCRLYRFLEATAQLLLWKNHHIDVANFDKTARSLPASAKKLFQTPAPKTPFFTVNLVMSLSRSDSLPSVIALKTAWELLELLDPSIQRLKLVPKIENALSIRNLSILAHGWIPIRTKAWNSFEPLISPCLQLLQTAFQSELPDISTLQARLQFIRL